MIEPLRLAKGRPISQEEKADKSVDTEEREVLED